MKVRYARAFLTVLTVCVLLTSCNYSDPGTLTSGNTAPGTVDYGNYDYSKKPIFSNAPQIYQNKLFFLNIHDELAYCVFDDIDKKNNIKENPSADLALPEYYTCPYNDEHRHGKGNYYEECPIRTLGFGQMVLDRHESAGDFPIFYMTYTKLKKNSNEAEPDGGFNLYKYSSETNISEKIVKLPGQALQLMIYGDRIYMSISTDNKKFCLFVYDKKTGDTAELDIGKGRLELLSASGEDIYFCDRSSGQVYASDVLLKTHDEVFKPSEVYALSKDDTVGIYINDGYIYYRDNAKTHDVQIPVIGVPDDEVENPQFIHPISYDIRRVSIADPKQESSLVASDVFEGCEFGFADNFFYYTPFDLGTTTDEGYYNFSNGRFCKVDLSTLETSDVLTNCGYLFDNYGNAFCDGKMIISTLRPLGAECSDYDMELASRHSIYDIESGEIYFLIPN